MTAEGHRSEPGYWVACQHPEKPMDNHVYVDFYCPACRIAAAAYLACQGDTVGRDTVNGQTISLSAALACQLEPS